MEIDTQRTALLELELELGNTELASAAGAGLQAVSCVPALVAEKHRGA